MTDSNSEEGRTAMPSARAHIRTDRASRYLIQLAKHSRHMGAGALHGRRRHDDGGAPPKVLRAEWSDTAGVIDFGWGHCTMNATHSELVLTAEADDDAHLTQITAGIAARVHRIGRREQITVTWDPARPAHD